MGSKTNTIYKIKLLIFLLIAFNTSVFSQTDNCGVGSTLLTPGTSCVYTAGNTAGFTDSNQGCVLGDEDDDGWFRFVATATTHTVTVDGGSNFDCVLGVYNTCGGTQPTGGACIDNTGTDGIETRALSGLTIGTTYYICVHDYAAGSGSFNICVTSPPSPPANDNCTGATVLSVSSGTACTTLVGGTVLGATTSTNSNTCGGTADDDVWYSFVATSTSHSVTISNIAGSNTDMYHSVYAASGGCNSIGAPLVCSDPNISSISGLTIGATYFVRAYTWTSTTGQNTTFSVCVTSPPSAPANDDPTGAIPLTPAASCSYTNYTTVGATATSCGTIPTPGCASYSGGDVWFSVVVPASGGFILDSQTGGITDGGMAVYSGVPCGAMSLLYCDDDSSPNGAMPSITVAATAGSTVYIRFWEYGNVDVGTFGICATTYTPPPAPSNNNPCGATPVTVNPSSTCTSESGGSLVGATSSTVGLGSCFGNADDDVWYSFVATSSTHTVSLNNVAGSATDLYHSVHPGPCGAIGAALVCSDPNSSTVTGLTIGTTYFIRVYSYTSGAQTTTFSVCVTTPPPPPPNDNPCGATSLTVNPGTTCTSETGGTVSSASSSTVGLGSCIGNPDDDVWYSFVATNTTHNISLNNVAGSTTDMYHSVHPGPCGAIGAALVCSDANNSTVSGLTIGTTYYIRVYTYTSGSQTTTFSVCVTTPAPPSANVDCLGSTPICGNASFSGNSNGEGIEEINGTNQGCIGFTGEQQSSWYTFKILTGGTLSFTITTSVDYDFAIWGAYSPTATAASICPITTTPIRCSFAASGGNTGLGNGAVDNSEGVGGNRWVAPMNVTAGQVYEMLINNYAADLSSFTLTWGGTAVLDCSVILPIELISFTATNYGSFNRVNWSLSSDIYDDYFVLEHSYDGVNFNQIDTIRVLTNNNEIKSYNLKDYKIKETTYYRLKQVKKNKSFLYSKIVSAQSLNENDKIIKIYPNPTKDQINVDVICKDKNDIKISLIDNFGNEYFVSSTGVDSGQSSLLINLNNFDAGMYLLKITFEKSGKTEIQKIIKN